MNKVRILHISANTNNYHNDYSSENVLQVSSVVEHNIVYINDAIFPPRFNALHPRLQSKIPKMLAFELFPDYDYYIWTDSNITLKTSKTLETIYNKCSENDIVLFKHHLRNYLHEEFSFMFENASIPYLQKYVNEPFKEQLAFYEKTCEDFHKLPLYEMGCFMFKNNLRMRQTMKEWFYQNARYSIQDQLSIPYVLDIFRPHVGILGENIIENDFIHYWGY